MNSRTLVLSTAPHNFAGAGAAHARTLELLASSGAIVQFWAPEIPFRIDDLERAGVQVAISRITSDAYGSSDTVIYGAVAEGMLRAATQWLHDHPDNRVILFATYLFPFCTTVEMVARILCRYEGRVECVLNPAGSDIWQIGRQIPEVARQLIDSRHVTAVVTYSTRFASEIRTMIGCERDIVIIPPAIDVFKFAPLESSQRAVMRGSMGISEHEFVISHCSNHRPVKGLSHVFEIARCFAAVLDEDVHLLMIGPITAHLCDALVQAGLPALGDRLPYAGRLGKLHITCTGLQEDVRHYHAIGDVALNTSLHDSFNISLGEAMACESTVLTTDVAGITSLIKEYECGDSFPFEFNPLYTERAMVLTGNSRIHIDVAVAWLVHIQRNEKLRKEFGKRARLAIVDRCSDAVVAKKWCQLFSLDVGPE